MVATNTTAIATSRRVAIVRMRRKSARRVSVFVRGLLALLDSIQARTPGSRCAKSNSGRTGVDTDLVRPDATVIKRPQPENIFDVSFQTHWAAPSLEFWWPPPVWGPRLRATGGIESSLRQPLGIVALAPESKRRATGPVHEFLADTACRGPMRSRRGRHETIENAVTYAHHWLTGTNPEVI